MAQIFRGISQRAYISLGAWYWLSPLRPSRTILRAPARHTPRVLSHKVINTRCPGAGRLRRDGDGRSKNGWLEYQTGSGRRSDHIQGGQVQGIAAHGQLKGLNAEASSGMIVTRTVRFGLFLAVHMTT